MESNMLPNIDEERLEKILVDGVYQGKIADYLKEK
jgi:hypothetical protein